MEIHSRFTRKSLFDRTFCLSKLIFTYVFVLSDYNDYNEFFTKIKIKIIFFESHSHSHYSYIFPIFYQGFKNNGLDFQDLYRCPKDDEAEKSLNQLKRFVLSVCL